MTSPIKSPTLKLCPQGFDLWRKYETLALEFNKDHPLASAAWDDFVRHYRGTSSQKGCKVCSKR